MKKTKADFNFVYGVFKSREKELIDEAKLASLFSSSSFEDAVTQLPDSPFSQELNRVGGESGIDAGIKLETSIIADFLMLNSPSRELKSLVFLPWDYFNLKVAVLSKLYDKKKDVLFGPEGDLSVEELKGYSEEMDFIMLPNAIYDSLQEAWIAYYEEDKNTQAFEFAVDRQKNLHLLKIAYDTESKELHNLFTSIDEIKIGEILIRAKNADLPWSILKYGLSGFSGISRIEEMYSSMPQEWNSFTVSLRNTPLKRILDDFSGGSDISEAVLREKRALYSLIDNWKYYPPGIEYSYYFLTRKLSDLYNIRMILIGKLKNIDNDILKKRIVNVYI